ncbi:MUM1 protein, partial [Podargus strigoides]|nr:MUM1 protein [Podargus strigoides]
RISVSCADAVPLKEECIENIASNLDQRNNLSEAVEELKYRRSLKIALDILNQNGSARPAPLSEEGGNAQLSQENSTGSLLPGCLHACQSFLHPEEKLEPETSKKKKEQRNNPSLKADTKKQSQEGSSILEESDKAHGSGTNPSKCSTGDLCDKSNSGSQNPESKSLPRQEKVKPRSLKKPRPGNKVSLKPKEEKSKPRRKNSRGAGSPVSCGKDFPKDQVQPLAEEGAPLSAPCQSGAAVPVRANGRHQLRRMLLGSSGRSASDDVEKRISNESERLAKQLDGGKKAVSLKQVHGEQEMSAVASSSGKRNCRNCPESSSGPLNSGALPGSSPSRLKEEGHGSTSHLVRNKVKYFQLPDFEEDEEPQSIEGGILVWCKLRRYPYWPAVVKNVRRKDRKAYVMFIEGSLDDKRKGFSVPFRNLKHFDCEEKQDLIERAKEEYGQEIEWCICLIADYRIRVGCHSFTGSFLEYFAADISYPVRKGAYQGLAPVTFPHTAEEDEESSSEASPQKPSKKLLPDRTRAARDKANKKIVEFIVKTKGAEEHLLAILKSRKQSRWLKEFLNSSQYETCIETYLEDEEQLDLVVNYLKEVYHEIDTKNLQQINRDEIKFISDVLLPEAIIYAISAVDDIDYKKAEEKYIKGPSVSKREREIFDEEILERKRWKAQLSSPDSA